MKKSLLLWRKLITPILLFALFSFAFTFPGKRLLKRPTLVNAIASPQLTDVSPAVTGVGNNVYMFAKTTDNRIVYRRAVLGQSFTSWSDVNGGGQTNVAPAAAAVGNHVFVIIRGLNGKVQINQADLGRPFGAWFPSNITTDVAPAAVGVGNTVYFFVKATNGRIMTSRAVLGQAGTPWVEVEGGGQTNTSPAAGAVGNHIFLAIRGLNGKTPDQPGRPEPPLWCLVSIDYHNQ